MQAQRLIEYDLRLAQLSQFYDLTQKEERKRSARSLRDFFYLCVKTLRPDVSLEIGAHDASYSMYVQQAAPRCRVFAFEANKAVHERFAEKLEGKKVDYRFTAVANVTGTITFQRMVHDGVKAVSPLVGHNSLLKRAKDLYEYEECTVPSIRLDDFAEQERLQGCVVAWIDVEGALGMVLEGATKTLDMIQALFIEVEDASVWKDQKTWNSVLEHMVAAGFMPIARDFERKRQFNVLFMRAAAWAKVGYLYTEYVSHLAHARPLDEAGDVEAPLALASSQD